MSGPAAWDAMAAMREHLAVIEALWADKGRRPGAPSLRDTLGLSMHRARKLVAVLPERVEDLALLAALSTRSVVTEPNPPPAEDEDIEELIARREREYQRRHASKEAHKVRTLALGDDLPIGILHVGDPHLDDDYCDLGQLRRDIAVVKDTDGLYGGCVGDVANNWIGRLAALYADQGTTKDEAVRLAEWFIRDHPWLYFVLGNHDVWGDGGIIFRLLFQDAQVRLSAKHEIKATLVWPTRGALNLHIRHDFPGHSQWNPNHGLDKRSKFEPWAHLLVAGHKHISHADIGPGVNHWRVALRVAGYKVHDDYAEKLGFIQYPHRPSALTILDPAAPDGDKVRLRWDIQAGAEELTWLRSRG